MTVGLSQLPKDLDKIQVYSRPLHSNLTIMCLGGGEARRGTLCRERIYRQSDLASVIIVSASPYSRDKLESFKDVKGRL